MRLYVVTVIALGVAVIPLGYLAIPETPTWWVFLYLAIGTQIATLMPIAWSRGGAHTVATPLLIAAGLLSPGVSVGLIAWLFRFDGRRPGKDISWWVYLFNNANIAISYGYPSLLMSLVVLSPKWSLLIKTVVLTISAVTLNFPLTARVVAYLQGISMVQALVDNISLATIRSMLIMGFSGGMLFLVLQQGAVGYIMALGFFGVLLAIRGNLADAERQTTERLQTLQLAAETLDARDPYTESHSQRVADLAARLGDALGLSGFEIEQLHTAGALHDLGKIGIRDAVLNKADRLTDEEWEIMKQHPDIGADMIAKHSALAHVAPLVRFHHERWNGTGYPQGLRSEDIPLGARIIAVADSFDTISTARVYRPGHLSPVEAVEDITARSSTWYDPQVVNALRQLHGLSLVPLPEIAEERRVPQRGVLRLLWLRPGYGRFVVGTSISSLGDPLTTVASLVWVYGATHDPTAVAATYIVKAVATVLISVLVGTFSDRVGRARLIVSLELSRAAILVATPFLLSSDFRFIYPLLFALAAINAIVAPARQAALPELVEAREVGAANAGLTAASMVSGAIGFALAGLMFFFHLSSTTLFLVDGVTFAIAGALVLGLGDLGGGASRAPLWSSFIVSWGVSRARLHLGLAALSAFFLSMSFPALITLAYRHVPDPVGAQTYTLLEVALTAGIVGGSILVGRLRHIGTLRTVAQGLVVTGIFSVGVAFSPWIWLVAAFLFIASLGNPVYSVGNVTALMDASVTANRGTIMSTRFGITQLALVLGASLGGVITSFGGPELTYGILGAGLIGLALVASGVMARERHEVAPATQQ